MNDTNTFTSTLVRIGFFILPIAVSLLISALLIIAVDRDPLEVMQLVWEGAFRNQRSRAGVLNLFIALTLVSIGLVVTFRAGLWNIGVEGQMMMGAVFASIIPMAFLQNESLDPTSFPQPLLVGGSIFFAMIGGIVWAALVGILRIYLGINEIFGGVALNALANVGAIYLISGPWEPDIGGSAQGTEPFPAETLIPQISNEFPTSLLMLVICAVAFVSVAIMLMRTRWGLNLKATGLNAKSALLLGVSTDRVSMSAFLVCGALAGIAGSYRSLFTFDSLRPLASGGIGFLGLLVVLLISIRIIWVPLVAFLFAVILSGSTRLRISLQLDSSLASVLQSTLVLLVLLSNGVRDAWYRRRNAAQPDQSGET